MNNKINYKIIIIIIIIAIFNVPTSTFAQENHSQAIIKSVEFNKVAPYSDIIKWRYKSINGKLYKRQFNYTTQQWIGDWIPC